MGNLQNSREKEKAGFWRDFRNYFREYCQCSSIHGFRYFGERRTVFERVWWIFVFMACLTGCVLSIYLVYKKWEQSPVIVTFSTRTTPIYDIPFPAVTICSESKIDQTMFNWTDVISRRRNNKPIEPDEEEKVQYMKLLCNDARLADKIADDVIEILDVDDESQSSQNVSHQPILRFINYDYFDYGDDEENYLNSTYRNTFPDSFYEELRTIFPESKILKCTFMNEDCKYKFVPIITDEGICYTFNMLNSHDIYRENVQQFYDNDYGYIYPNKSNYTIQDGYDPDAGIETYPYRALLAGAKSALEIDLITAKSDIDYACMKSVPVQGYRVLLHTAMRIPRPGQQYFRVPLDKAVSASVQPVMITTSESVKLYNPKRRECFFTSERYLKYFINYSSLNCQLECLTNLTLALCGCVNFFMPKENGTSICGYGKFKCMEEAEKIMHYGQLNRKINKKFENLPDCDCKPICSDLTYDAVTSQTRFDWKNNLKASAKKFSEFFKQDEYHISGLIIYFKSDNFIKSQRNELYGPTDFLANFGGLLGLFTGFSVLSLMEIVYFLSVRLICNSRLYGYWSGAHRS